MKLVALDLKGQKAETPPLRVIIMERTVDPKKRQWALEQQRLAQMAKTLSEKAKELMKDASQVQKVTKQQKSNKAQKTDPETQLARLKQSVERTREQANDLWEQLKKSTQAAPTKLDAEEARLLGERLSKLRNDSLKRIEEHTSDDSVEEPESVKRFAAEAFSTADAVGPRRAETSLRTARRRSRRKLCNRPLVSKTMLTESSLDGNRDQAQRPKWQERERAALAATEELKVEFEALKAQVHGGQQSTLDRLSKDINEVAHDMIESLDKPADPKKQEQGQSKSPEHLYTAADNLRNRLQRSADAVRGIADEAARRAVEARARLQKHGQPGATRPGASEGRTE